MKSGRVGVVRNCPCGKLSIRSGENSGGKWVISAHRRLGSDKERVTSEKKKTWKKVGR